MAKATTAKAPKKAKKAAKAVKSVARAKADSKKKKAGKKSKGNASDALWKLAEHPMVGELLAIGATAAVAAIAEQGFAKGKGASTKAVKAAGKAAAAAIGARLISEFAAAKQPKPAKS